MPRKVFMSDAHDLVKDKIKGARLDSLNFIQFTGISLSSFKFIPVAVTPAFKSRIVQRLNQALDSFRLLRNLGVPAVTAFESVTEYVIDKMFNSSTELCFSAMMTADNCVFFCHSKVVVLISDTNIILCF